MKKLLLILFCLPMIGFGQTSFKEGWKEGYKKGYCGNKVGCVPPIPPIPPSGIINHTNQSDYQFGYNQGLLEGSKSSKGNSNDLLNNYTKIKQQEIRHSQELEKKYQNEIERNEAIMQENIRQIAEAQAQQRERERIRREKEKIRISKIPLLSEIIEVEVECSEDLSYFSHLVIKTSGWKPQANAKTIVNLLINSNYELISEQKVKKIKKYKAKKHSKKEDYLYLNFIRNNIDEKNRETTVIIKDFENEILYKAYFRNISYMKMLELLL